VKDNYQKSPHKTRARAKKWRIENHEKYLQYMKDWRTRNKAYASEIVRRCHAKKRKTDINYRLQLRLRWRLWNAIRGYKGITAKTRELLGCTVDELKTWLESKFQHGMSWDNYGLWHIDHIIPCASFDFGRKSDVEKCFHFSNLQPSWAKDNCSKGHGTIPREVVIDPVESIRRAERQDVLRASAQVEESRRNDAIRS